MLPVRYTYYPQHHRETRLTSQKRPPPSVRFFASFLRRPRREKSPSSLDRRRVAPRLLAPSPPHSTLWLQKCNRTIERSRRIGREESGPAMAMRATGRLQLPVFATVPRGLIQTHTHCTRTWCMRARMHPHSGVRLHATHYVCTPSSRDAPRARSVALSRARCTHHARTHVRMYRRICVSSDAMQRVHSR